MEYEDYPDLDSVIGHYVFHRNIFLSEDIFSNNEQYYEAKKMHYELLLKRLKYRFRVLFFDENIEDPNE